MSKSNATGHDVLAAILSGIDPSWRSSATMFVALHTANPGVAGIATTNEVAYGGYTRVTLTKATAWVDSGATFTNATNIVFPLCTSGSAVITHFSLVSTVSGTGQIFYSGALSASLSVVVNIQPQFIAGALSLSEA